MLKRYYQKILIKKIVDDINATGGKAIGLSGNKNNFIEAKKIHIDFRNSDSNIEKILDLGFVGKPINIATNIIDDTIAKGLIPVVAPLGIDKKGNTYNINADTVAGAIAGAIKASKLLLLTDVAGILDQNNKLISTLSINEARNIINEKTYSWGNETKNFYLH